MAESITVFAPATVANVACGFDALGFALHKPGDKIVARRISGNEVVISKITGEEGKLPLEADRNTAGVSVKALLQKLGIQQGIELEIHKQMPLGSGLGSSSASSGGAVFAANELLGRPLEKKELLPFAMEGERIACGAAHADNVAPSLLGGFTLVRSYHPLDVITLPFPEDLFCAVIHPHVQILTEDSRRVLRRRVRMEDAITQWSNLGGLISGLYEKDYDRIAASLTDVIFEPIRSLLIPGFDQIKAAAIQSGALGCSISGSGPSVFALCRGSETAEKAAKNMQDNLADFGLDSDIYVSAINPHGTVIIDEN